MFVKVKYYKSLGGYQGREYYYETDLDLKRGDCVIAPTKNEAQQKGLVTEINLPDPGFPCRRITEFDPEVRLI